MFRDVRVELLGYQSIGMRSDDSWCFFILIGQGASPGADLQNLRPAFSVT